MVGNRIGRIRVESVIGKGGMGEVYVGYDETLQRRVALKSIRTSHRLSAEAKARFVREARILSRLDHPNICKIHDFIESEDGDHLVLEFIEGRDLKAAIRDGLEPARRLPIAREIANALVAAHAEGIVHRDLKPANVMLTQNGEVKVLDFGLARTGRTSDSGNPEPVAALPDGPVPGETADNPYETSAPTMAAFAEDQSLTLDAAPDSAASHAELQTTLGAVVGTLTYMSPEQASGENVTTASDMYSFGLLLQTLFTGLEPYPPDAEGKEIFRRARAADTLPVTGLEASLTRLIESLKSPAPAARPTAVETAARLRWIADRPKRRAKWLAVAAALAILLLGGLKYTLDLRHERTIAVEARTEADLRRGQAEDLIGFMLGDLREKLAPVGRLDILDDVGDKALDYFASLAPKDLTDDELHRRSRALSQIGEVRIAQGDLDAALRSFDEALVLASRLVDRDPSSPEWLAGLGTIHFWIGNVHWLRSDLQSALSEWRIYLESSERLVELEPQNEDWQLEVGYAHTNLGAVHEVLGETQMALAEIGRANEIKARLMGLDPANSERKRSLANGLSWHASILETSGDLAGALKQYEAELELRQLLAKSDPRDSGDQQLLAISHGHVGQLLLRLGRPAKAEPQFQTYRRLMENLVERDPENAHWQRELAVSLNALGLASIHRGDLPEALTRIQRGRAILERLLKGDSSNLDWQLQLGVATYSEAMARNRSGKLSEAAKTAREALALLEPLAQEGSANWAVHQYLSLSRSLLGHVEARRGREAEARRLWRNALEAIQPMARDSANVLLLEAWARALLHSGRPEEAKPVIASLVARGFADPDFVRLSLQKGVWPGPADSGTKPEAARQ